MARTNSISVLKTTRAALDINAQAGNLLTGEPYFITDENRLAVGSSTTAYQRMSKQGEAEAALSSRLLPSGGLSGQLLSRNANGDPVWIDAPAGAGPASSRLYYATAYPGNSSFSSSAQATKGRTFKPLNAIGIRRIISTLNVVAGATYIARTLTLSGNTIMEVVDASDPYTASAAASGQTLTFSFNHTLYPENVYALVVSRADGADNYGLPVSGATTSPAWTWLGVEADAEARQVTVTKAVPQVGNLVAFSTAPYSAEMAYVPLT
jgi:hypothetical protein